MQFTTLDHADRHNRYAYADLNPITNVDPTGRTPAPDAWHPVMIGLGILFTVIIGVASASMAPATIGALGVVLAVGGGLADLYSVALGLAALLAAADASTSIVDERTRAFLTSDDAWLSELVVGIGLAAAAYLAAKALPRFTAGVGARSSLELSGSRSSGEMTGPRASAEMTDFASGDVVLPSSPSELVAAWAQQLTLASSSGPLTLTTRQFTDLLNRTGSALEKTVDPLATVYKGRVWDGGRVATGFRAWLAVERGVPLEVSAQIYAYAGHTDLRSMAMQLRPHMTGVLMGSRLRGLSDEGSVVIDYMQTKYDELYELVARVNVLVGARSMLSGF
jgi:hypothetical protein